MRKKNLGGALLALTAMAAGFCNALLGAGGGILLTLVMEKLCNDMLCDRRDVLACSQGAMIVGCAVSCLCYSALGDLRIGGAQFFLLPAVLGGILGSLLLNKISPRHIRILFALLVIWSGARMVLR
jgi:uncharacterized membrane protein YfcA